MGISVGYSFLFINTHVEKKYLKGNNHNSLHYVINCFYKQKSLTQVLLFAEFMLVMNMKTQSKIGDLSCIMNDFVL